VADDGPGPDPNVQPRMFDLFATFDDHGGTGLGLAIVHSVADAHGGNAIYHDGWFVFTIGTATDPVAMG
jgi:signal transduction histidine kinase